MTSTKRRGSRLYARRAIIVVLSAVCPLIAAIPWICGLAMFRPFLLARANAIMAPGSVEYSSLALSWLSATRIEDVVLRDAQGDAVVSAPRAEFNWSLGQILFHQPWSATLRLQNGLLDIERMADGRVDLYETLRPVIDEHPKRQLIIAIEDAKLRLRDRALAEPITADHVDLTLDLAVESLPITWDLKMAREASAGGPSGWIKTTGSAMRLKGPSEGREDGSARGRRGRDDATIKLNASNWPLALEISGMKGSGEWSGSFEGRNSDEGWSVKLESHLGDLMASGGSLGPVPWRHHAVEARVSASGRDHGEVTSTVELSAPFDFSFGRVETAAGAGTGETGPTRLTFKVSSRYSTDRDRVEVASVAVDSTLAKLSGHGTISGMRTNPSFDLEGLFAPDWKLLTRELAARVEPNARIEGQAREWRLSGMVRSTGEGRDLRGLKAEFGTQIDDLDFFGLRLSRALVVFGVADGKLTCAPIDAALNDGTLHLEPRFYHDSNGGFWVGFGRESALRGATIDEKVSHRVLSFVAPVLDGATRVEGRVSVAPRDIAFPLTGENARARVEGDVLFDDVRFLPGPLAAELIQMIQPGSRPSLVLREPISVRIADRKVYQRGLVLPIGQLATIGVEGFVDFDRNLDLVARLSANPDAANGPLVLSTILQVARFEIPIRGTLSDPRIDEDQFKQRMKAAGSELIENSVQLGVEGLGQLLKNMGKRRERRRDRQSQ